MKMKRMSVSLMLVSAAAVVHAVTYTWDGGGADNNWSTLTNWNPDTAAPVSASNTVVQFDGATRLTPSQDIANPFVLNRLEFLGGPLTSSFTISSNQLQYVANGATQPCIYLRRNATCTINNAIDIPAGTTLSMDIGTYGVNLNGVITGGGAIDKNAASGGIDLRSSANSFSGGLTIRANDGDWNKVNIYASGAMGTGPVSLYGGTLATNKLSPGGLNFYNTTTHTNPISLFANSPIFAGMPNGIADAVTLNGVIDLNSFTLHLRGGGSGTVGSAISEGGANAIIKSDAGTWTLGGTNTFAGKVILVNGTLKLGAAGSLASQVGVSFSCATGWYSVATATLDLNGRSQAVSQLDGTTTHAWLTNTLTSATAATLTVDQSATTVFNGRLTGALRLVKTGAGSLTLSNFLSATTGGITVSNGTLAVASGASLGSTNVTVAGGTLSLQTAAAIPDAASLSVADGAKVLLGGGATETVDKLFINGVQQPRGFYGTTASGAMYADDVHFGGTGMLYVTSNPPITPTSVTWDAEGTDLLFSTPANWVGDAVPLFDGTNRASFASGGLTASVDVAANLYGLTFNREGAFTLAAGAGVLSNGAGGIAATPPTTTGRNYAIAEDVVLTDHQTWNMATNPGVATLSVSGVIDDGFLPCNVTKTGFGPLELTGSNTFDGAVTVSQGDLKIYHSQALGSTNGSTTVFGGSGARLYLYGNLTLAEPLVLSGEWNNSGTLVVGSGSNTVSGPVTCYSQVRLVGYNGPLEFTGGVTADNNGLFVINSGSTITFSGKPLNLGTRTFWSDSGGIAVLAVSGNNWADTMCAGGGIRCEVPDALPAAAPLHVGVWYSPGATLNLNGNNQTTSKLFVDTIVAGVRVITSATPALMTVNQSANTLFDGRFTGAVSLLKLGAGMLTLTNAATSTTGSFVVSNGTLVVGSDGTFGNNSTNIVVGGTGTLALSNSVTIANSATLRMPAIGTATAKINLAAGVNETVGWLYFGEKMQRAGTYGSTGSIAALKDNEHFAGTGMITVLHDKSGSLLRVQ